MSNGHGPNMGHQPARNKFFFLRNWIHQFLGASWKITKKCGVHRPNMGPLCRNMAVGRWSFAFFQCFIPKIIEQTQLCSSCLVWNHASELWNWVSVILVGCWCYSWCAMLSRHGVPVDCPFYRRGMDEAHDELRQGWWKPQPQAREPVPRAEGELKSSGAEGDLLGGQSYVLRL